MIFLMYFMSWTCHQAQSKMPEKNYKKFHLEAQNYCKSHEMNTEYYFLLDLSLHPGRNRFFVINIKEQKIIDRNLVTHGSCDVFSDNPNKWEKSKFDNRLDSHCSMKGKYKIGKRDWSAWGIKVKYWLEGLEESNQNAVKRVVVLHSWEAVSNTEIYPEVSPLSWGCPAVSDVFMQKLDAKLKASKKPVLLWIVD